MCETNQLIYEDLVEALNNLILYLYLFIVRSHLQKPYFLIDVLVDVIDVKKEHIRGPRTDPCGSPEVTGTG